MEIVEGSFPAFERQSIMAINRPHLLDVTLFLYQISLLRRSVWVDSLKRDMRKSTDTEPPCFYAHPQKVSESILTF